jgi:putative FmdB family regulatory protein
MPTYSYNCPDCGTFDAIRPMAMFQLPLPCPACGGEAARAPTIPAGLGSSHRRALRPSESNSQEQSRYQRWKHAIGCGCCGA